ncbi:MAG: glycosyltransferase family 9 protein [Verrucomicrobia bacterium]|nr:glycosyltransferase family 9 protein [Verrucomicrobiota bacterium]
MKTAVISCLGLGDGLLALVLSNNLALNGHEVVTYHPFLNQLQDWFPHLPIAPFSEEIVDHYQQFFFIYDKKMDRVIEKCYKQYPNSTYVLNPIATPKCDYRYWEVGRFNGRLPFADNLEFFCRDVLKLKRVTKENGIRILTNQKFEKRVIIHPTSSRPSKNWPKEKFLRLANYLEKDGYETAWVLTKEERPQWPNVNAPAFSNMSEIATFVAESGMMIGNDSGIGHLASCLGLPTVTICRHKMVADFWRPSWANAAVVLPPKWVPNLKGFRFRDKHWQKFVSVERVRRVFHSV